MITVVPGWQVVYRAYLCYGEVLVVGVDAGPLRRMIRPIESVVVVPAVPLLGRVHEHG